MAYAFQYDIAPGRITERELLQLTCDDDSDQINEDIVNGKLNEAAGMIDSYCRARYVTPLQPSEMIRKCTVDIAVYLLFARRRGGLQPTEMVRQNYEDAISFLKDVAAARASLDQDSTVSQTPQTSTAGPQTSERDCHLRFSDKHLKGFV